MAVAGQAVSHYRIIGKLGSGGMGVIYEAEDLRLSRRVALKFLPEAHNRSPLARERLKREARAASSLNHPNICTIYDVGEHNDESFIVMELLQGQTLRQRIRDSTLSAGEILDIGIQLADGLHAAHHRGIIHRDLKPENIFITTVSQAKILDFGVAKLEHPDNVGTSELDNLSTMPVGGELTKPGLAVGTIGYMSPEQALGKKIDTRTDLFSFGTVLYEMSTRHQAFTGDTMAAVFDAILNRMPPAPSELNPQLPPMLEGIIGKALEKDRELRYQFASEIRGDLKRLQRDLTSGSEATGSNGATSAWASHTTKKTTVVPRKTRILVGVAAAIVLLTAAIGAMLWLKRSKPVVTPGLKVHQLTFNSSDNPVQNGSISPDGRYLAYVDALGIHVQAIRTGDSQIVPEPEALKGTRHEWAVRDWLPDGTRFLAGLDSSSRASGDLRDHSIWIVPVLGGQPRKLRDNAAVGPLSPDGTWLVFGSNFGRLGPREIWVMKSNGEGTRKLYETDDNHTLGTLSFSADNVHLLSVSSKRWRRKATVYEWSSDTQQEGAFQIRDLKGSTARTVLDDSSTISDVVWMRDGRLPYAKREKGDPNTCNYWEMPLDASGMPKGSARQLTTWGGFCVSSTSFTADSKTIAFQQFSLHGGIRIANFDNVTKRMSSPSSLTFSDTDAPQAWTPDSKAIVFISKRANNTYGIFKQVLGSDKAHALVSEPNDANLAVISSDGKWIVYWSRPRDFKAGEAARIMRAPIDGGTPEEVFGIPGLAGLFCARQQSTYCVATQVSEDGRRINFIAFDPLKGFLKQLASFQADPDANYTTDMSYDGKYIVYMKDPGGTSLFLASLQDGTVREIPVRGGWKNLEGVSFTADAKGFFLNSRLDQGCSLLFVDLQGNAKSIWRDRVCEAGQVAPSPDGRKVVIFADAQESNMWMMENF